MSLNDVLRDTCNTYPQRVALHFDARDWAYAELDAITDALAAALHARGVRRGDRIAFLLPNGPELVFVYLACFRIGAVAVPLNVRLTGPELAYILNHSRSRLCIAHAGLYPALASVNAELPCIEAFFVVGADVLPDGVGSFDMLLTGATALGAWPAPTLDDVAAILYTSGTTARPKGVTHTHGGLRNAMRHYIEAAGMTSADAVLGMLSMSHIFGFTLQMLAPLSVGATMLISSTFDPARVLGLIAQRGVTHLYGLPVMFDALTHHPDAAAADTHSLRYCLAGGDAVSPALNARMRAILGLELHEGCGMTEIIPYALNRPGMENRVGSIGRASVGMHLKLVNAVGEDVPHGEVGEILVKSDALMAGYWEDPDATAAAMRDGWFNTGDLGRCDDEGYYWFIARGKEIIVRGGSNISPLEVESVLCMHHAVREVAVVGAPDASLGETVAAFVVLNAGATAGETELKQFAANKLAAYKIPERFTFLPDLPRGLTGKVHRRTLKEWAAQQS